MSALQNFRRVIQKITHGLAFGGMFIMLPLMFITSADVVGRGLFDRPVPGTTELSSLMLVTFILSGLAYTHQIRGHVRVTMLLDRLPAKAALAMNVLTTALCILIMAALCWQGWELAWEQKTVTDMLRIPQRPFRILVAVAGAAFLLELLLDLADTLARLFGASSATDSSSASNAGAAH
jgi:TRAP-type C4-dicarboxylate transport system permease small subunit